ncbi:hypothetical protein [Rhodococcus sp. IEGM 1379]|uniref:hypothetical protein n=1 Tax=Rhodococcus sp. IEGM 1379 TaxID=3047086 RepID=UPI0024B70AA1|nr:hypothetical protein [Rhodococcus sp. IEGM 1379]MDI9915098.1 hypothetical protein [Rhodococcus sp. IEGM 1379]
MIWGNDDDLVWEFPFFDAITDTDAPLNWTSALEAVTRDLSNTSVGHEATLAHTSWELRMDADYVMSLGWIGRRGLSGFSVGGELNVDSDNAETTAWVANTLQSVLEDLEYFRWPLQERRVLRAKVRDSIAVWVDPAPIPSSHVSENCASRDSPRAENAAQSGLLLPEV